MKQNFQLSKQPLKLPVKLVSDCAFTKKVNGDCYVKDALSECTNNPGPTVKTLEPLQNCSFLVNEDISKYSNTATKDLITKAEAQKSYSILFKYFEQKDMLKPDLSKKFHSIIHELTIRQD